MADSATERRTAEIRVLVLTTSFPLRDGPPSGPFVQRLVEHLPPYVEATVLTPCFAGRQEYREPAGYRVKCFRYAPLAWQLLAHQPGGIPAALKSRPLVNLLLPWFLLRMGAACWQAARRVDVIHANWSVNGVVAGIVARLTGLPLVTTLRGEDVTRARSSALFRVLLKWSLALSDRVVLVSEAIRRAIAGQQPGMAPKIGVIPNGVERELLRREITRGEQGALRLVSVGSLIPRKSVSTLIRAVAQMRDRDSVDLVIVGDGVERPQLERLAVDSGVGRRVSFVGAVAPDAVLQHLDASDVLVLCSHSEGRPNVVLEAMAGGLAVVATTIDGVTEIVSDGETGLLFAPGDVGSLTQHLDRLCADPELRMRLAQEARAWILRENLLWDSTGMQYSKIYRDVLTRRI